MRRNSPRSRYPEKRPGALQLVRRFGDQAALRCCAPTDGRREVHLASHKRGQRCCEPRMTSETFRESSLSNGQASRFPLPHVHQPPTYEGNGRLRADRRRAQRAPAGPSSLAGGRPLESKQISTALNMLVLPTLYLRFRRDDSGVQSDRSGQEAGQLQTVLAVDGTSSNGWDVTSELVKTKRPSA